jgi:tellurite resistance protein
MIEHHHDALVHIMVLVAASDRRLADAELRMIGDIIGVLPVFRDYDRDRLPQTAAACAELLAHEDGLERSLAQIRASLPPRLRETAYALACDIAAADGRVALEEMRLLEMIRHDLEIERLIAAGIERGARARFAQG